MIYINREINSLNVYTYRRSLLSLLCFTVSSIVYQWGALAPSLSAPSLSAPSLSAPVSAEEHKIQRCPTEVGARLRERLTARLEESSARFISRQSRSSQGASSRRRGYRWAKRRLFRDVEPERDSLEGVYTGKTFPLTSKRWGRGVNCEHVWPRSWMAPKKSALYRRQEADLHNLYPTSTPVNSARGSLPFGTIDTAHPTHAMSGGSRIGADARGRRVFEVRHARRGDIARAIFYFATRWRLTIPHAQVSALKRWSQSDPIDRRERTRNERIARLQGVRNPFVDCPGIERKIWATSL
jgi:endonuclease I